MVIKCLLTEFSRAGRGKHLAQGYDVQTKSNKVHALWLRAKYFPVQLNRNKPINIYEFWFETYNFSISSKRNSLQVWVSLKLSVISSYSKCTVLILLICFFLYCFRVPIAWDIIVRQRKIMYFIQLCLISLIVFLVSTTKISYAHLYCYIYLLNVIKIQCSI